MFCGIIEVAGDADILRLKKITQRVAVLMENNMLEDAMLEVACFYNDIYALIGHTRVTSILDPMPTVCRSSAASPLQRRMTAARNPCKSCWRSCRPLRQGTRML